MKTVSYFRKLEPGARSARISFAGEELRVEAGENLAAELMAAGVTHFRHTPVSGAPRSPFCMMGACFDCLVEIDGITRQACLTKVRDGMTVRMPPAGEQRHD
ncbi:(2Fe-2S)-binding protein [Martelella sp. FOR1707]